MLLCHIDVLVPLQQLLEGEQLVPVNFCVSICHHQILNLDILPDKDLMLGHLLTACLPIELH